MSARKPRSRDHRNLPRRNRRRAPSVVNADCFNKLRHWLLPNDRIFVGLRLHGNTTWTPAGFVWLALCWAWSESKQVTNAFEAVVVQSRQLGIESLSTYQGFMNAAVRWTPKLMPLLWTTIQQRMERIGGAYWRVDGWLPIAFDGSRSTTPRTKSNEAAFCAANYGSGKTAKYRKKKTKGMRRRKNEKNPAQPQAPQAWITLMWHMGLRLPWKWRLGPSNSSERSHVIEMLAEQEFPENTLFCGDAGFVGYPLWEAILSHGGQFLIRVGSNVHLLSEWADCEERKDGTVYCWPKNRQSTQPPLQLRLVKVRLGKTPVCMLTSVLEPTELPKRQIINFYKMRWSIEVGFRGLKQTLGRAKLHCHSSKRIFVELHWSLMALTVAGLFASQVQLRSGSDPATSPQRRSLAKTIRALRHCLRYLTETVDRSEQLQQKLRLAVTDDYQRKKPKRARYRPPNPDKKPMGNPQIRPLTQKEKAALQEAKIAA